MFDAGDHDTLAQSTGFCRIFAEDDNGADGGGHVQRLGGNSLEEQCGESGFDWLPTCSGCLSRYSCAY